MNTPLISTSIKEKAVAYLRVSTKKQEKEGNSLEVQKDLAQIYAEKNNLDIVEFFTEAKSAYKMSFNYKDVQENIYNKINDRTILEKMIKSITKKKLNI